MSPRELRASLSLASIFGLRMLGMFIILPVFTLWARGQPGWSLQLAGIAIGVYGLVQAILQIPMGRLSDRYGRKPLIYLGLAAMAAGSFACASSVTPLGMITGRALQGVGAISGVAIAFAADLTRDTQRSKAMAIIGSTIGAAFMVSFVAAPSLEHWIGLHGIFAVTGSLALAAIAVTRWVVPDAPVTQRSPSAPAFSEVLRLPELVRLDVGIFVLHSVLMAMFVVAPVALVQAGLPVEHHWWIYLGAMVGGLVLMLPAIGARTARRERPVFLASIGVVAVGLAVLAAALHSVAGIAAALVIVFGGFNVLEAKLPALVSRAAPREARGAATGVYSSVQFLGTFVGSAAGGAIAQHFGFVATLVACLVLLLAWLGVAWNMGEFVPAASSVTGQ
ncbi:MAG TPA: MFS transporter [Usitatibacter sp.]|nr:MFS transporter [Usitatibacter sp.]